MLPYISYACLIKPYCLMFQLIEIIIADIGAIAPRNTTITEHKSVNEQNFNTRQLNFS